MPTPRRSALNIRKTGLVVAVGFFLIGAGVVGVLATRPGAGAAPATTAAIAAPAPVMPAAPVDVGAEGLRNAGRARFQFVDRQDPSKVAGQLEWAALEPLAEGRALVAEPRATVFLDDGLVAYVHARRGRIFTPPGSDQPESGSFEGGVPIALFAPDAAGRVDVDRDRPVALLFTPVLNFNLALGEVTLPDRFRLSTQRLDMAGRGLRVLGDQVGRRISLLEIDQTDRVRLAAGAAPSPALPSSATDPAPVPRPAPTTPAPPPLASAAPSQHDFYHLVIDRRFRAAWKSVSLHADRLDAWAELIDGALPAGAIGGLRQSTSAQPVVSSPAPSDGAPAPVALAVDPETGEPESLARLGDDPVLITWEGPLRLRPAPQRPPELEGESVAARFSADRTGAVVYTDTASAQRAQAARIEYAATTRNLILTGTGPRSVVLAAEGRGQLEVEQFTLNLGTGIGLARGPGVLAAATPAQPGRADDARQISWSDQADVVLAVRDDWVTAGLKEALFAGDVLARNGRASVAAGFVRAVFRTADGSSPRIARVEARENVLVTPEPGQRLRAQRLDVAFEPARDGRGDDPSVLTATGRVSAQRDDWRIDAGLLEATVLADASGNRAIGPVRFEQDVRIRGPLDTQASADRVDADVPASAATLTGRSVTLARAGAVIQGTQMALDGRARRLLVKGAGTFRYARPPAPDEPGAAGVLAPAPRRGPINVEASWDRELRVDDRAGTVEALGSARATSAPTPLEADTLFADRLLLAFTPADPDAPRDLLASNPGGERRLLRADALGAEPGPDAAVPAAPARIESRRYAESPGPADTRALERLIFVEGERIAASEVDGRIEVPRPGRLLVDDRRATAADAPPAGSFADFGGGRGTSLFSWQGGLSFDRRSGQVELLRQVRLLHRAAPEQPLTTLDCDRLTAQLRTAQPAASAGDEPARQIELRAAAAEGFVLLQNLDRTLQADSLNFDALANTAQASAVADNRVTLFDPARPQPLVAKRLIWDLGGNRVTVQEPAPVVVPR